jgi:5-formyltetrahydrofolate cyclo-ligase
MLRAQKTANEIQMKKQDFRRALIKRRNALDEFDAAEESAEIRSLILGLFEFEKAASVALYSAFRNEVDLNPIAFECERLGKRVLLPRFNHGKGLYEMVYVNKLATNCRPGYYDILEPLPSLPAVDEDDLNSSSLLWLVPGVGFDLTGTRLGFGKGYYDRLLKYACGCRIGVCYDFQIVEALPQTSTDVAMNMIVSEHAVHRVRGSVAQAQSL